MNTVANFNSSSFSMKDNRHERKIILLAGLSIRFHQEQMYSCPDRVLILTVVTPAYYLHFLAVIVRLSSIRDESAERTEALSLEKFDSLKSLNEGYYVL
jgi:hypothetical protein